MLTTQECWTSTPTSEYGHPNLRPVCESIRNQGRLGQSTDKHIQALIVFKCGQHEPGIMIVILFD